jgi:hypothetical protein
MLLDNKQTWLINLYGPNTDDPCHFEYILHKNVSTLQATQGSIFMVGYYCMLLNTSMDRKGNRTTNYHTRALKEVMNVMGVLELVEA